MRRAVLLALVLAACTGGGPTEPNELLAKRRAAASADTVLTMTPATVASLVNETDTVIGKVTINGATCGNCAIAFRNLDSTKIKILSTFNPSGQSKPNGLVVKSLAAGTTGIRGGFKGKADTTAFTITAAPPPPDTVGVQAAQADALVETISVQTHIGYGGGVYDTKWTTVQAKLQELGVRHIREKMFADSQTVQRTRGLAPAIKLTAGCFPRGSDLSNASHCVGMANAYGTQTIDAFDAWNEVDNQAGFPSNWTSWQTTLWNTYQGNGTWASRPVLGNSLASAASADQVGSHPGILTHGNLHSYPYQGNGLPSNVTTSWVPQYNKIDGGKPDFVTETGYHTCPACNGIGVSELAQAKYTGRIFMEYWNAGIVRTNIYELMDEGTSTTDREDHWGLVRFDGTSKPSFTMVKNLIALLSDPGAPFTAGKLDYTLTNKDATTHTALFQKRNGHFYLAIWQEKLVYAPNTETDITNADDVVTLTLPSSMPWKTYKPLNGTSVVSSGTGSSVTLNVPDHVLIVEIG